MAREVKKEESFDRWKMMVFNKQITEDESLEFYDTWAENVKTILSGAGTWFHGFTFISSVRRWSSQFGLQEAVQPCG